MQLASAPRQYSGQNERPLMAVRPAPASAGDPLLVSRFLPARQQTNNSTILHRTTSAKTRATATLRQLHIPPNVSIQAWLRRHAGQISHNVIVTKPRQMARNANRKAKFH
jgi:hypothetical protein